MSSLKHAILLGMMGLLLSASTSHAGGSKRVSTCKVVNQSGLTVFVTTNPTSSAIQAALANSSVAQFIAAGGQVINNGSSGTFSVSAGNFTIAADAVNSAGTGLKGYITEGLTATAGGTVTVYIVPSSATSGIAFSKTSQ